MKEIEILVKLQDEIMSVQEKLLDFEFKGIKKTLDIYYYNPQSPKLQPNSNNGLKECFRLRSKNGKYYMTYKIDHFDGDKWLYSDEHETRVLDFENSQEIIKNLGLQELIRINNTKHIYLHKDYEIALEEVNNLGLFLEVEKINVSDNENINKARKDILDFIKNIGLDFKEMNIGKPEIMLNKLTKNKAQDI